MNIEEIKNKYMGMAEYASLRLGTTLDSMCCTVEEVGILFREITLLKEKIVECINCHNEYIHPALCPYCENAKLKEINPKDCPRCGFLDIQV